MSTHACVSEMNVYMHAHQLDAHNFAGAKLCCTVRCGRMCTYLCTHTIFLRTCIQSHACVLRTVTYNTHSHTLTNLNAHLPVDTHMCTELLRSMPSQRNQCRLTIQRATLRQRVHVSDHHLTFRWR